MSMKHPHPVRVRFPFILLLLSLFLSLSLPHSTLAKPYPAAVCISRDDNCSRWHATRSELCSPFTPADDQTPACVAEACSYCTRRVFFQTKFPCNSPILARFCGYVLHPSVIPTPTASPTASVSMSVSASPSVTPSVSASASITASVSPSVSPATPTPVPSGCLWTGSGADDSEEDDDKADDDIVMDLSRVPSLASGWTPCYRDGFSGLIYKRQRNLGIDPRPDQNGSNTDPMCFSVYPRRSGTYFLTSLSYAPHNTEHNDAWVSSSHGFELWRRSVRHSIVSPGKWRKAYQNFGKKGIAMFMKTIDHNGHRFLVPNVKKGEVFKVCLAGRSFRYEMFRLVLIKCRGAFCTGGVYRDVFQRVERTEPRCLMKEEIEREREEEMTAMVTPEAR